MLKDFVATGASDEKVANWFSANSKVQDKMEIIRWNKKMLEICEYAELIKKRKNV